MLNTKIFQNFKNQGFFSALDSSRPPLYGTSGGGKDRSTGEQEALRGAAFRFRRPENRKLRRELR